MILSHLLKRLGASINPRIPWEYYLGKQTDHSILKRSESFPGKMKRYMAKLSGMNNELSVKVSNKFFDILDWTEILLHTRWE